MPQWSRVDRSHVLAAMAEYDREGSKEFLRRYGFGRSRMYTLWHRGNEYDSTAILGVAYLYATGAAATPEEFSGGESGAAKVLTDLGFDVVAQEQPVAPKGTRKALARKPEKRAASRPVNVCPQCHMALPASGVCDFCD
jgi:hypothetical protein